MEVPCSRCGATNPADARFCHGCGGPLAPAPALQPAPPGSPFPPPPYAPPPPPPAPPSDNKPVIALILGILGCIMCGPLAAIPGVILARSAMNAIQQGRAPQSGQGMAKAAFYLNIAALVLSVLGCMAFALMSMLGTLPMLMRS